MNKTELSLVKKILLDVAKIEIFAFESLPDVEMTHSDEYNNKLNALMEKQKQNSKWTFKKIAIVLIASVLFVALSVSAVAFREPIKRFFTEVYETFTELFFEKEETYPKSIETSYTISNLSDESVLISDTKSDTIVQKMWLCNDGVLIFEQSITQSSDVTLDTENADYENVYVGKLEIFLIQKNNTYTISWINYGYLFTIVCPDSFPWNEVEQMIVGIIPE